MNPDKDREFEGNMNQLIRLLKKLLKNFPGRPPFSQFSAKPGQDAMNVNVCFFTFLPLSPDEWEAFEDAYEQAVFSEEREEDFSHELTPSDEDFLRRNGIQF